MNREQAIELRDHLVNEHGVSVTEAASVAWSPRQLVELHERCHRQQGSAPQPKEKEPVTDEQITAAFQEILEMDPRPADLAILKMMGATPEVVADYLWDHMMGEPDEPTLDAVTEVVERIAK